MGQKQAGHQGRPLVSTIRPTRLCLKPRPGRPIFLNRVMPQGVHFKAAYICAKSSLTWLVVGLDL